MNTGNLITAIFRAVPYSNQISGLEIHESSVRFSWRGEKFRVSKSGSSETVGDGVLIGSNTSILLSELLKRELLSQEVAQ